MVKTKKPGKREKAGFGSTWLLLPNLFLGYPGFKKARPVKALDLIMLGLMNEDIREKANRFVDWLDLLMSRFSSS